MKTLPYLFLMVLSIMLNTKTLACTCAGPYYFCSSITQNPNGFDDPTLIIKAIKLRDTLHGMFVQPLDKYIGDTDEQELLVWGDNGALCRPYLDVFPVDDTLIIALVPIEMNTGLPEEQIGDWYVSVCGVFYLTVKNDMVNGPITSQVNTMPLADFDSYMFNEEYETNCIVNDTKELIDQEAIVLAPNPASDFISIALDSEINVKAIDILNIQGQSIGHYSFAHGPLDQLDVSQFPTGVYFVNFQCTEGILSKKVVIQRK